jgi:transposase-like protein
MSKKRKRNSYDSTFKGKVALAAVRGDKTISELSSQFSIHAGQVNQWKRKLLDNVQRIFEEPGTAERRDQEALQAELYQQIGQLKMELEWLKKKAAQFG